MRNTENLNNRSLRVKFLLQIRNTVSQIITLLRELFEEVSRHEVGMDVLTKLLNRRFPADYLQTRNCPCQPDRYTTVSADY